MDDEGLATRRHAGVTDGHSQGVQGAFTDHSELCGPGGPILQQRQAR